VAQVWNEVLALARQPGVLDLGQGWPDFGASSVARSAAADAITRDDDGGRLNQYTTANGLPALNAALAEYYGALHGWQLDPSSEVLVTTSATEGLYACLQVRLWLWRSRGRRPRTLTRRELPGRRFWTPGTR
jgi:N-succinyldiaminopimelate aminotransferase